MTRLSKRWVDLREYVDDALRAVGKLPAAVASIEPDPDFAQELIVKLSECLSCLDTIVGEEAPKVDHATKRDRAERDHAFEHFFLEFSAEPRLLAMLHSYPKVLANFQAVQRWRALELDQELHRGQSNRGLDRIDDGANEPDDRDDMQADAHRWVEPIREPAHE